MFFSSCFTPKVVASFHDIKFEIKPFIQIKDSRYFLIFQLTDEKENKYEIFIKQKVKNDSVFFYVAGKTSMPPFLGMRELELKDKKIIKFIKNGHVSWLNQDGKKVPLEIR